MCTTVGTKVILKHIDGNMNQTGRGKGEISIAGFPQNLIIFSAFRSVGVGHSSIHSRRLRIVNLLKIVNMLGLTQRWPINGSLGAFEKSQQVKALAANIDNLN